MRQKNAKGKGYVTKQGYHLTWTGERYEPTHRVLLIENGEVIPDGHVVHHIDGDKLNNNLSNLIVCSKAQHRLLHHQLEEVSMELVRRGLITFVEGKYVYESK
jgi:hypothetical protein